MWKKRNEWAVGGLTEIGFQPNTDLLLVLSSQGRGLFDCVKGEKIARNNNSIYAEICVEDTGKVKGIGILEGTTIQCGGFEFPDILSKTTNDGWTVKIQKEIRSNWELKEVLTDVMYLQNKQLNKEIEVNVFYYNINRAYGFSDTGNSFVIGTSSELKIWNRDKIK